MAAPVASSPRAAHPLAWVPLALLLLLASTLWFVTTFVVLLPLLIPAGARGDDPSATFIAQAVAVLMLVIFQMLAACLGVSTARCVRTAPGDIPSWLRSDGKSDLHSYSNLLQAVERKRDGSPRFCRKTGAYKPDRAHYCREVDRCVLQFHTFSAPLNSAIGFYNFKFYLLALFYGTLCTAWVVASTLPEVLASGLPQQELSALTSWTPHLHTRAVSSVASRDAADRWAVDAAILVTMVLASLAFVPCALALCLHVWLVARGRTYYEWRQVCRGKRNRGKSLFDVGLVNNLALTLGVYPLLWLLPTPTGVEGNGIFYPPQERVN